MGVRHEPANVAECDKEIGDYRLILPTVSIKGRIAVWEQIDKLLELRLAFTKALAEGSAHPQ